MAAPDENQALEALKAVQAITAEELNDLVTEEIGAPMLGVFSALVRASEEGLSDVDVARRVHLMVLGFLLRRELTQP